VCEREREREREREPPLERVTCWKGRSSRVAVQEKERRRRRRREGKATIHEFRPWAFVR
jgi:hypothetical protein